MRSFAGHWAARLGLGGVVFTLVAVGCSLANAPDDVKAGPGAGGSGGSGSTVTTSTDATTTSTTTTSTTTTTTTSTGAGGSMCPEGYGDCDGNPGNGCESPLTTLEHCGACATTCDAAGMHVTTPACTAGTCDYDTCADGYDDCDQDRTNGCEAKLDALDDCGKCGVVCSPANVVTATCTAGACGYDACQPGFSDCDGDPTNGCENAQPTCCPADCPGLGGQCVNGVCSLTKWSEGTNAWPDEACNPTDSFGGCNTNAQDQADAWATFVCQQNGFTKGVWTGNKAGGCNGPISMYCGGQIPCTPLWENTCQAGDQTKVELTCTK